MSAKKLDNGNFSSEILQNKGTCLVDFYADWCGPCKMVSPIIEEIAREHSDVTVGKVNVDENGEIAMKYGIMSIPTIIAFRNGVETARTIGYRPKEEIEKILA